MKKTAVAIGLLIFMFFSFGQDNNFPKPTAYVNDYVGLLDDQEKAKLNEKLKNFNDTTTNEIAIAVVDDIQGDDIDFYAASMGDAWGIGKEKYENGILILLYYTGRAGQNEVAIAVGKGLEAVVPDLTAKRIVDNEMVPNFKLKNYYQGLDAATDILMQLAVKEVSSKEYMRQTGTSGYIGIGIFFLIFILIIVVRFSTARQYARSNSIPFWTALWLSNSMGSRGSFSSFSSGSGSFGGFGGGSFGGGGASGSW